MKFSECIHSKETRKRDSVVKRESGRKRLFRQGFNTQDDNALLPGFEELSVKSVLLNPRNALNGTTKVPRSLLENIIMH